MDAQTNSTTPDPKPAADPAGGTLPGQARAYGTGKVSTREGLTLVQMLRLKADEFELARGGQVGPSLVVLLRDAADAIEPRQPSRGTHNAVEHAAFVRRFRAAVQLDCDEAIAAGRYENDGHHAKRVFDEWQRSKASR